MSTIPLHQTDDENASLHFDSSATSPVTQAMIPLTAAAQAAGPSTASAKNPTTQKARLFRQRLGGPLRVFTRLEGEQPLSKSVSPRSSASTTPRHSQLGGEITTPSRRQRIASALSFRSDTEAGCSAETSPFTSAPTTPAQPLLSGSLTTPRRLQRIATILRCPSHRDLLGAEGSMSPRTPSVPSSGGSLSPARWLSPRAPRVFAEHVFPAPLMEDVAEEEIAQLTYHWRTKTWRKTSAKAQIYPEPFTFGNTCAYHFMHLRSGGGPPKQCVARRLLSAEDEAGRLELDVFTTALCQQVAAAYNATDPVKRVQFVDSSVIQCPDGRVWGVEGYLPGEHALYGGNRFGLKEVGDQKHDQAFCHFSYEYTKQRLLITELRGAALGFRHPTVYTHDGVGFGAANQGRRGIEQFFHTHWCSSACRHAGLETHLPKRLEKRVGDAYLDAGMASHGTFTASAYMRPLRTAQGGLTPEELTLLGLTSEQLDRLVDIFTALDKDRSGDLSRLAVQKLRSLMEGMPGDTPEGAAHKAFAEALRRRYAPMGTLTFHEFILLWSNNA